MSEDDYTYVGNELELFASATNWKTYYSTCLRKYVYGDVLEVGAGIGGTSAFLCNSDVKSWTCLEPDPDLAESCRRRLERQPLASPASVVVGTTQSLESASDCFDTLLYIDVIEHIDDDAEEVRRGLKLLKPRGRLIALSPAHQWLFSPFDRAVGHFRRYSRQRMANVVPEHPPERVFYIDSVGLAASMANKLLLRQSQPTRTQISLWDKRMIPLSRWIDPILCGRVGKTVVGVWRCA